MTPKRQPDPPRLRLVKSGETPAHSKAPQLRELDWSILMARAQDGDASAYHRLLEEMTPYLRALAARRFAHPQDLDDCVQDILLTVHAMRASYDPARPFAPWLVALANRRVVDVIRRKARQLRREHPADERYESYADPDQSSERSAENAGLEAALATLPAGQQQALRLLKLEELSLKEAAQRSGQSIAALKVATHRALKSLRARLTGGIDHGNDT